MAASAGGIFPLLQAGEVGMLTAEPAEFSGVGETFLDLLRLLLGGELAAGEGEFNGFRESVLLLQ